MDKEQRVYATFVEVVADSDMQAGARVKFVNQRAIEVERDGPEDCGIVLYAVKAGEKATIALKHHEDGTPYEIT